MYLAFKWLMLLAVAMWVLLCSIDSYLRTQRTQKEILNADMNGKYPVFLYKNITRKRIKMDNEKSKPSPSDSQTQTIHIAHYLTFFAGALAVTIYNRKSDIYSYTKNRIVEIDFRKKLNKSLKFSKRTAINIWVATLKISQKLWGNLKGIIMLFVKTPYLLAMRRTAKNRSPFNNLLLKKLEEVGQERNNLRQLLITAIQENKNIRMQYQLEYLAKNRLIRQIQETQKQIKENRSRYVNFQHLYLVTHQENIFLKNRIKKLNVAKEEAENRLMSLIKEIYRSKDSNLKSYCTNFVAMSKENLLKSDVSAEIKTYLQSYRTPSSSKSNAAMPSKKSLDLNITKSWPNTHINENMYEKDLDYFIEEEQTPKLRGLPGEYVWTVKDKDGIIEKLYEYDYGYNFDNGDTIRRIREYSVYHDKDCLLDFKNSKSTTIFYDKPRTPEPKNEPTKLNEFSTSRNFLTGSAAFQSFLENNKNVMVPLRISPAPPVLCR